ncbi:MAG TPA: F0F1 ATP synthase subunit A [Capsulimonadaceae bacterium]|jgi:F-type H+-transporting ATPase subunit a
MEELAKHTWLYLGNSLIAALIVLGLLSAAAAKKERVPGRFQNFFEFALDGLRNMFLGALGPGGEKHLPIVLTLFFYILIGNFLGMVPALRSPTAATSVTIALGIVTIVYVHISAIQAKGVGGYLKHFLGPVMALAPLFIFIEIVGEIAKPFSLAMRLFGNIFGEDQIVEQIYHAMGTSVIAHLIPVQVVVNLLQAFTNLIQAFIFALLTCGYLVAMTDTSHDDEHGHDAPPHAIAAE